MVCFLSEGRFAKSFYYPHSNPVRPEERMLLSYIKCGNEENVREAKEHDMGHTMGGVGQNPDFPSSLLLPGLDLMVSQ